MTGAWWRRPSWTAAATVACVGVPHGDRAFGPGVQVTAGDLASVVLMATAAVLVVRGRTPVPRAALWAFGPLIAALGAGTVFSSDVAASVPGFLRDLQIFVLVPLAVVLVCRDRRDLGIVCGAVLGLGFAEAGYGIWQAATGNGAAIDGANVRAVGTFGATDVMAMSVVAAFAFAVLTAFALAGVRRTRGTVPGALAGLALLGAALVLALSRGTWLALGVAVVLMLVLFDRWVAVKTLACGAALTLLVGVFAGGDSSAVTARARSMMGSVSEPDQSVNDRYHLWAAAQRMWQDNPVMGVGVKNFAEYRDTYAGIELSSGSETHDPVNGYLRQPLLSPHNQYLLVLAEQGVVGLAGFAALFAAIAGGLWRRCRPRDPYWLAAVGCTTFLLVNFLYSDLGGPTSVLYATLIGVAAARAFGLRRPAPALVDRHGFRVHELEGVR
ncbi:O-antigen ligase family protein [Actinomadura sp. CNU-125]|uniref:O-antigen ligase family protein n=1 Tax=Actinomadura sp. CNU-125 TaxID=1904961 RepID=UPI0009F9757D|nr:O-antigen ligase family protein [Actinomadura sp. CNU-125]